MDQARTFHSFPNMKGLMTKTETGAYVAQGAIVVGDVRLAEGANVWFGCVLRGDDEPITVGERSNIQDGTVVHVDWDYPVVIGKDVTIGHKAMIHGCEIGDGCLIGMGAILLTGCKIGERSIVAAGAVVTEGAVIPPGSLVAGIPGKIKRELGEDERERLSSGAEHYIERAQTYL